MKLYNRTTIPDAALIPVLAAAGRAVGARTTGVVVKLTYQHSQTGYLHPRTACYGSATLCDFVANSHLATRRRTKAGEWRTGWVGTDGGLVSLVLPRPQDCDPLALAQNLYTTAAHEWNHIRDFQGGAKGYGVRADRLRRHANRPWERRAYAAASRAARRQGPSTQDCILALGLELERLKGAGGRT